MLAKTINKPRMAIRRQIEAAEEDIQNQIIAITQDELNRLYRQVQLSIRRINQYKPKVSTRMMPLKKVDISGTDMWQQFEERLKRKLVDAMLDGYVSIYELMAIRYTGEAMIIDTADIAANYASEIGLMIKNVSKSLKRYVGRKVVSWYNKPGAKMSEVINDLQDYFGRSRAERIAMTEITNLDSHVQNEIANKLDIEDWWWNTKRDSLVCTHRMLGPDGNFYAGCRELHGKIFKVGVHAMPAKGSHPGCRCKAILMLPKVDIKTYKPIIDTSHLDIEKLTSSEGPVMPAVYSYVKDVLKVEWEEEEHPRKKDGKFTSKGQGEAGGNKKERLGAPVKAKPAPGDIPGLDDFRDKHYRDASKKVLDFLKNNGMLTEGSCKFYADMFDSEVESKKPYDVYRDMIKMLDGRKKLMSDSVEKDYVRLLNAIRVAEYHFIKKASLTPMPVSVKKPSTSPEAAPEPEPVIIDWKDEGSAGMSAILDDRAADIIESGKNWMVVSGMKGAAEERLTTFATKDEAIEYAEQFLANGRPRSRYSVKQPVVISDTTRKIMRLDKPLHYPDKVTVNNFINKFNSYCNEIANNEHVKPEIVKDKINNYVHSLVDNEPIRCRVPLNVIEIILKEDENRFKSQYETKKSRGWLGHGAADKHYMRRSAEEAGLGIPPKEDDRLRPVYGYINEKVSRPSQYGEISFAFHDDLRKRTTFTLDDSLGRFDRGSIIGVPLNDADLSLAASTEGYSQSCYDGHLYTSYVECQVSGGMHLGEAVSVTFHADCFEIRGKLKPEYEDVEKKLKERGLTINYEPAIF